MKTTVAIGAGILISAICGVAATAPQAPARASSAQVDRARIDAGKRLFAETCRNDHCHGGSARNMEDYSGFTADHLRTVIRDGVPDAGMQAFKDVFTAEQIEQLVAYILSVSTDPASSLPQPAAAHAKRRATGAAR